MTIPESESNQNISAEGLKDALGERYLQYALSTIMNRALPDARDGLKPVHRRLLFAMRELRLDRDTVFKKCARVVGDVIGKYHPHGDQSVYDALVRLAQDFSQRYPLINGQGNFGNIDGDNAAAMRYTESKLTEVAKALLAGLEEDAVDFRETYDGQEREPVVLPAAFPNLLANGSSGIAVGMATNIPPHNAGELCDALLHLLKMPNCTDSKLSELVVAPDFPTGGVLIDDRVGIQQAYRTGRGSFRLRAHWTKEDLERGQYQIVVSEIPYQVQKSKLVEKIAELITSKKLVALADVRDESAEDIRLVLEPRSKNIEAVALMEALFKQTELEVRISLNMNVLVDGRTPKVCSLREVLQIFLDHQQDVLCRRSRYRLGKIAHRLEILDGYIIAYLDLDRVIEIIRYEDEPKQVLVQEFKLSDLQAEAILNMRLRNLRRLEEIELRKERDTLSTEQEELQSLLNSEERQYQSIGQGLRQIKKNFGQTVYPRLTRISTTVPDENILLETLVDKEPVSVICSNKGWIRTMKGHIAIDSDIKYKDGDEARFILHAQTTDKLLLVATNGRIYTISVDKLPSGRSMGEPVRLIIDLPNEDDILDVFTYTSGARCIIASSAGYGFVVEEDNLVAQTRSGKQVLNVKAPDTTQTCYRIGNQDDHVAVVGENRKLLVFALSELPEMGRGKGVRLQAYKGGGLSDLRTFKSSEGLKWKDPAGRIRVETDLSTYTAKRATAGRIVPRGFPRETKFT